MTVLLYNGNLHTWKDSLYIGTGPWNFVIMGSGLSPVQYQVNTLTNADLPSTGPKEINFNENWLKIPSYSFRKGIGKYHLWNVSHFASPSVC